MTIVKFGNHRDVTKPSVDGKDFKFPFTVTTQGHGALHDKRTEHSIIVGISNHLLWQWKVEAGEIAKYLLPFAWDEVKGYLIEGSLRERHKITLLTNNAPDQYPFKPSKLSNPNGATYTLDLEEERRLQKMKEKEERGFGFQIRREDV